MRTPDLVIVGAGVAGLTAAAVAARRGLAVTVVESQGAGGQVMNVEAVHGMPGLADGISGYELGPLLQEQAEAAGAEFALDTVEALEVDAGERVLICSGQTLRSPAVIVAAGSRRRVLDVPGEERLLGRGVSQCASCDGPLFRGRSVCVVGGGDSALDEALVLSEHAERVTLIHRGTAFTAQQALVDRVAACANIDVLFETVVDEILGDAAVDGVALRRPRSGEAFRHRCDGVFVYVGLAPNTGFLGGLLRLDERGRIETDRAMRSSLDGVYAAGDIRAGSVALLASSAGDGAVAAVSAQRYLSARGR